jgi:ABC-2 type transport system permease protein/oleandomycin transport system permease protein
VLLFVYVFGGAIEAILPPDVPYVDFLMPGIFVQTAIFSALQTGVGLAEDLQKGLIDRFKSLPMARSAVLAGRTAADGVAIVFQIVLMFIVAWFVGFRFHEGILEVCSRSAALISIGYAFTWSTRSRTVAEERRGRAGRDVHDRVPVVFASAAFVPTSFPRGCRGGRASTR